MKDHKIVRKFDILTVSGKNRIIKSVHAVLYVTNDKLFVILHSTHSSINWPWLKKSNGCQAQNKVDTYNETIIIIAFLNTCVHMSKTIFKSEMRIDLF